MKTLLERAKPELLAGMELERAKYAPLVEHVEKFLKEHHYINQITWDVWIDMRGAWSKSTNTLPDNPWECFN